MKYLIYGLIDPRSLLVRYIGKSTSGLHRPKQHANLGITTGPYCANWIRSLQTTGLSYDIVVLEYIMDKFGLADAERWWVAYGRCLGWPLTNLTNGGEGSEGRVLSKDTKAKISASLTGRPANLTPEVRARLTASRTGRKHTPETKAKIARANAGKLVSELTRIKLSKARKGIPLTEECKQKLHEILKGKPKSEDHKRKIGLAHKGRVISESTKAKIAATLTGRPGRKHTEETKRKIGLANKGKIRSEAAKLKYRDCALLRQKSRSD